MANSSKNNRIWIPVVIVLAALLIALLAILLSRTVLSREGNPAPEATTALSTEASSTDTVSYFSNLSGSGSGTAAEDSASDTSTVTAEDNEDELTYLQAVAKSYSYTALLTKADKLDGKVVTFSGPITSIRNQWYRIALENNTDESKHIDTPLTIENEIDALEKSGFKQISSGNGGKENYGLFIAKK